MRRVTNAERLAVGQILIDANSNGMLDQAEWEQRSELLLTAKTEEDLKALYADLTGTSLPVMMLSVDRDWYVDAGRVHMRTKELATITKWAVMGWCLVPLVVIAAADYYYDGTEAMWAMGLFVLGVVIVTLVALFYANWIAHNVRKLLSQVGVD